MEISAKECCYRDGREPKILDIVEIGMVRPAPKFHQTENHVIDSDFRWRNKGEFPWEELKDLADKTSTLWLNRSSSSNGLNDRVKADVATELKGSLLLIKPKDLTLLVRMEGGGMYGSPKRRVRARFDYNNMRHILAVTDPVAANFFLSKGEGEYLLPDTYICLSLAGEHDDRFCYKLVAGIISKKRLGKRR